MSVRNGILSTLRAKGRTTLFVLLILMLTVALALGLGMWAYSGTLLARMEEQYTSVALVEYMGEDYPDEDAADSDARAALTLLDNEAMSTVDGVELWEQTESTLVSVSGYQSSGVVTPYSNNAVIVATIKPEYTTGYGAVDEADLPESRAVLYDASGDDDSSVESFILPDGNIATWSGGNYVFYFSDIEILKLPYYYNLDDATPYQAQGSLDEVSEEEPDGPYVLLHHVIEREGTNAWNTYRYDIMGELPAEYDQDTLQDLLENENARYYYSESTETYMGYNATVLSDRSYGRISYALHSPYGTDSMICFFALANGDFVPEDGKTYLLNGAFVTWGGAAAGTSRCSLSRVLMPSHGWNCPGKMILL